MRIIVDSNITKKHNLSIEEFLILYLNYRNFDIKEINESLVSKSLANYNVLESDKLVLSNNTISMLSNIMLKSNKNLVNNEDRFNNLAEKLMEIFPEGKKAGTTYYWRGNKAVISARLQKLVDKTAVDFTDEEAIDAARRYVNSFKGDYKYMSILQYFIWKKKNMGEELDSQFLSYIENKDSKDENNYDWTAELK